MYAVNPTGNQTTPDSSVLLLSPSTHGDSPLLDSSLNTTVKRKRRHKHSYLPDHLDNPSNSKRFNSSTNENDQGLEEENVKKDNKCLIGMELRENGTKLCDDVIEHHSSTSLEMTISFLFSLLFETDIQNRNGKRRSPQWSDFNQSWKHANLRQYRRDLSSPFIHRRTTRSCDQSRRMHRHRIPRQCKYITPKTFDFFSR